MTLSGFAKSRALPGADGLTETIVAFATRRPMDPLPEPAVAIGKRLMLETVGVALAAVPSAIGRICTQHALEFGSTPPTATVIGAGLKLSPPMAAMVNATLSNALDYDSALHVATPVLPAVLAVAEHEGLSGRAVFEAFAVGVEIGAKLMQALDGRRFEQRGPTQEGWWHVSLIGTMSSAVAVSRLLNLDEHRMAMAIGTASCSSGGFRRNMGTMAKAMHSGQAASAGIHAAYLARRGFTADPNLIEAPLGFADALTVAEDRDFAAVTERLGNPYFLAMTPGIKRYPACAPGHPLIAAALQLRQRDDVALEDIEAIEADLQPFSLLRPYPTDDNSAGFSGVYLIAAALVRGRFGLHELEQGTIDDPAVRRLMERIRHLPASSPGKVSVTLHLTGGRAVSEDVSSRPPDLVAAADIERKFQECAEVMLTAADARAVMDLVYAIDDQPDISALMNILGAGRGA